MSYGRKLAIATSYALIFGKRFPHHGAQDGNSLTAKSMGPLCRQLYGTAMLRKISKIAGGSLLALAVVWAIVTTHVPRAPTVTPCTQQWFLYLEDNYFQTSDEGHGPDLGDADWFYIFESKAKLPDSSDLRDGLRCQRIQDQLSRRTYIINPAGSLSLPFSSH